ncbi:MAG: hypothetical protein JNK38_22075 [Acidobacteria bacterium]|nr:hypothetical protein [Acidobacteriota bacterium]
MANADQEQIKLLRDQVARLISQNLELRRQLDDFEREKTGLTIDEIGSVLIQAMRSAEEALAAESPNESRYLISQLQTTLRGFLSRQATTLTLRMPRPEQTVPTDNLGSVQLNLVRVPPPVLPNEVAAFGSALEIAQAAFNAWSQRAGANVAGQIVALATQMRATLSQWTADAFLASVRALADAAVNWSQSLGSSVPDRILESARAAAKRLFAAAQLLTPARRPSPEEFAVLAAATQQLAQSCLDATAVLRTSTSQS